MIRPCVFNRRLRLSLLQRPFPSESPHRQPHCLCAFAQNRHISAFARPYSSPNSRSILHSLCRIRLLSISISPLRRARFARTYTMATKSPLPTITLTEDESKVRNLLVDVAASIDATNPRSEPTVLRITGGWVRDKLLKGKSHDIDIGINNMTGFEFASHLNEFLNSNVEKYNIPAKSIHKIESNPEKSKHLETATTKILGLDIDFVNLRSETYSDESRIPQMQFGTPTEDALRRDACVNALFYNLMTQQVEDFTERGLADLEARLLRTPLPPVQTFKDDPLRVLRLIRFASRLSFTITPDVEIAMQNPEIKTALRKKISRERVGVEIEKMLYGEHPYEALDIIERLGLGECIFDAPSLDRSKHQELNDGYFRLGIETVKWFLGGFKDVKGYDKVKMLATTERDQYLMWIFAAAMPWINVDVNEKKKKTNAAVVAAREGLKMSNKDSESLERMTGALPDLKSTVPRFQPLSRSELGTYMRKLGSEWRLIVLASLTVELVEAKVDAEGKTVENWEPGSERDLRTIADYEQFLKRIDDENLGEVWDLKYLLTGNELQAALNQRAGKWMKTALEQVMTWQLDNPKATKEDALENIADIVIVDQHR